MNNFEKQVVLEITKIAKDLKNLNNKVDSILSKDEEALKVLNYEKDTNSIQNLEESTSENSVEFVDKTE